MVPGWRLSEQPHQLVGVSLLHVGPYLHPPGQPPTGLWRLRNQMGGVFITGIFQMLSKSRLFLLIL